jgi:hypothetical protein
MRSAPAQRSSRGSEEGGECSGVCERARGRRQHRRPEGRTRSSCGHARPATRLRAGPLCHRNIVGDLESDRVQRTLPSTFCWPAFAPLSAALGDRLAWGATHVALAPALAVVTRSRLRAERTVARGAPSPAHLRGGAGPVARRRPFRLSPCRPVALSLVVRRALLVAHRVGERFLLGPGAPTPCAIGAAQTDG